MDTVSINVSKTETPVRGVAGGARCREQVIVCSHNGCSLLTAHKFIFNSVLYRQ